KGKTYNKGLFCNNVKRIPFKDTQDII
ncbi:MAG: hypothetical protein ACJA1Z_001762, partial [Patiriisocius sp.]